MITWLLLVYGLTLILTESKLLEPVRAALGCPFDVPGWCFLRCSMCIGGQVGLLVALAGWPVPGMPEIGHDVPFWLRLGAGAGASAFASSGWCWMVHVVLEKLGASEL